LVEFIAHKNIPVILAVLRIILVPFFEIKPPHPSCLHYFWLLTELNKTWFLVTRIYVIGLRNSIFRRDLKRNYLKARKESNISKHYIKLFRPIQRKTWFRGNFASILSPLFSLALYHIRPMLSLFSLSFLSVRNECK